MDGIYEHVKKLELSQLFVSKLNSAYNGDPKAMATDLMQTTLNLVEQIFAPLTIFFEKYTTQQQVGKPLDPCNKLRTMLVALKDSGDQFKADVWLIDKMQGTTKELGQAAVTPLPYLGFPMTVSHLGGAFGGSGLQNTNPASKSLNTAFLVIKGKVLQTKYQNLQSALSRQAG